MLLAEPIKGKLLMLTVKDVIERVQKIFDIRDDDEMAHIYEDNLYLDVLKAIAEEKCDNPAACAREAVKADEIKFSRWHA